MKLRQHQFSIQPQIFDGGYEHPWYQHIKKEDNKVLHKPNPPSKEAVERARFIDKTYECKGRSNSIRSGD